MSAGERAATLGDLPLMPRNADGPVFAEPWQAQAFATVVELIESGRLSPAEWAETLGATLREAEGRGEFDTGSRYYQHWLTALERLAIDKALAGWQELADEKQAIEESDHHRREHQLHGDHGDHGA
ncbi:MAG: nitrile hydratase accessory protein [Gammaproteobacteria bacterium]|nr:nitrile hydratase accessory protein [Gammaproteobacteria bacterium]